MILNVGEASPRSLDGCDPVVLRPNDEQFDLLDVVELLVEARFQRIHSARATEITTTESGVEGLPPSVTTTRHWWQAPDFSREERGPTTQVVRGLRVTTWDRSTMIGRDAVLPTLYCGALVTNWFDARWLLLNDIEALGPVEVGGRAAVEVAVRPRIGTKQIRKNLSSMAVRRGDDVRVAIDTEWGIVLRTVNVNQTVELTDLVVNGVESPDEHLRSALPDGEEALAPESRDRAIEGPADIDALLAVAPGPWLTFTIAQGPGISRSDEATRLETVDGVEIRVHCTWRVAVVVRQDLAHPVAVQAHGPSTLDLLRRVAANLVELEKS